MAEAKNVSFDSIMADLEARRFAPVYYLMGEESYYIDKISDYIAEHVLQPEERDFNQTVLFGSDVTASQVADYARRYPMMSEYQVIIVKEAQLRDRDLPVFIENYLRTRNVSIDAKSTQIIADSIGADLSRLSSELDKVILSLPEQDRRVTPQVVEDQIGVSKEFNGFELRDAIVNRNVFKANQIIKYFDENPKAGSIYAFLPLLFNYFQNLMIAYYAPNNKSQEAVAEWLELRNSWAAKDYMIGMRNYTGTKVMQIIGKIREIDAKSKGLDNPNTPPGELMKELIFYILH